VIDLSDRRVLITGGSRGIGAACAREAVPLLRDADDGSVLAG